MCTQIRDHPALDVTVRVRAAIASRPLFDVRWTSNRGMVCDLTDSGIENLNWFHTEVFRSVVEVDRQRTHLDQRICRSVSGRAANSAQHSPCVPTEGGKLSASTIDLCGGKDHGSKPVGGPMDSASAARAARGDGTCHQLRTRPTNASTLSRSVAVRLSTSKSSLNCRPSAGVFFLRA